MNITDAIDIMESISGVTDESTPVGEAWNVILRNIHNPTWIQESDAFAIVQMRLDVLAGDQELMIYRWPEAGDWNIEHTNPYPWVQLGEVSGKYSCDGITLEGAVRKLANALYIPETP